MLNFHVKFVQTDRRRDRRTMVKQFAPPPPPPFFRYGALKTDKKAK